MAMSVKHHKQHCSVLNDLKKKKKNCRKPLSIIVNLLLDLVALTTNTDLYNWSIASYCCMLLWGHKVQPELCLKVSFNKTTPQKRLNSSSKNNTFFY